TKSCATILTGVPPFLPGPSHVQPERGPPSRVPVHRVEPHRSAPRPPTPRLPPDLGPLRLAVLAADLLLPAGARRRRASGGALDAGVLDPLRGGGGRRRGGGPTEGAFPRLLAARAA